MKCYIGQIDHTIGDRELTYTFKFQAIKKPNDVAFKIVKNFWGKCRKFQGDHDTFVSFDDAMTFGLSSIQEISQSAFDELHIVNTLRAP